LGAVVYGHQQLQAVIQAINELVAEVGVTPFPWAEPPAATALIVALKAAIGDRLEAAYRIQVKSQRKDAISALRKDVFEALKAQAEANGWTPQALAKEFGDLEYHTMRAMVLATKSRVDGRDLT